MSIPKKPYILSAFDAPLLCCWNMALASYTRRRRQELGLSLERAAELAGLKLSEWDALEAGWVPEDLRLIQAIAGTLETDWAEFSFLALMTDCQQMGAAKQ
jgi:transcriptional regulator with XRE-family HTH domain